MTVTVGSIFELRVCDACGHENVREFRPRRDGELPCLCGGRNFTTFDPTWVERNHQGDPECPASRSSN
jgi:hypothetical protein